MPEPEKLKMPSLLSKSTWGKAAAQVGLAKGLAECMLIASLIKVGLTKGLAECMLSAC